MLRLECETLSYPMQFHYSNRFRFPKPSKANLFLPSTLLYNPSFQCPGGEIGRRKGLKIPRGRPRAGSIPAPGTI